MNPAALGTTREAGRASEASETGDALVSSLRRLARTQSEAGCWSADYSGPMFLLPMYIGTLYSVGHPISERDQASMRHYILSHQNPDGGFGLHIEGSSLVFSTSLNYVALRLLGASADDASLVRARRYLHQRGGPLYSASWGKFFLALLGLYDYRGLAPLLPELWLLPDRLPVHPSRMWCHARMVYLPMSYLYGRRAQAPLDGTLCALREELYPEPYANIAWAEHLESVALDDALIARSRAVGWLNWVLIAAEKMTVTRVRERALQRVLEIIDIEDQSTHYVCLGPINKLYNLLVWHHAEPGGARLERHLARLPDYLWTDDMGSRMKGYNSSELWDTTFAVQALTTAIEAGAVTASEIAPSLRRAYDYLEANQVLEDPPQRDRGFRDGSRGGWPFSTRAHGWPISDCTAEGIKTMILLEKHLGEALPARRLEQAVDWILSVQNSDGGFPTYERARAPAWLERLNPSDCFAEIMIDYSYVECTAACLQALRAFRERFPEHGSQRIDHAIEAGTRYLLDQQHADGSWEGSWGVCFTYGTWFAVTALRALGFPPTHFTIRRACEFLVSRQLDDGGWSELVASCLERRYVSGEAGHSVMTAWALLTLIQGGHRESEAASRGFAFLRRHQLSDGSYPYETTPGVFNKTCAIRYDNYSKIFPLWAFALERSLPSAQIGIS